MRRLAAAFKTLAIACRLALLVALAGVFGVCGTGSARETGPVQTIGTVRLENLPTEARDTLYLIRQGGPFPYPHKDGSIFGNFERHLPPQPRGYYREYTVPTPGRRDRGPRRIVAGLGKTGNASTSDDVLLFRQSLSQFPANRRVP
ncbi:ribonuclease domain-containing protein [Propionivibrio limicola]|uniref:ribonuclease domain-containing protein n=1 Tax=Propionivibrio limicola TaxID=167645 RepID=UPI0031B5E378